MATLNLNILIDILITGLAVVYSFRIAYALRDPTKREAALSRYDKNTPGYKVYEKVYSSRFLTPLVLVTIGLVINLALDIVKSAHFSTRTVAFAVAEVASLLVSLIGLILWVILFAKQKSSK